MRLFLALALPPDAVAHLDAALAPARAAWPQLRWVPSQRWHLTLAFYGEVADAELPRLRRRVTRQLAGRAPLELGLARAGRFGHQVLWVGLDGPSVGALRDLGRRVSGEDRPYRPHLTVARSRADDVDLRPLVEMLLPYAGPGWTAATVHLVRSRLGPTPSYDDVARFPLGTVSGSPRPAADGP